MPQGGQGILQPFVFLCSPGKLGRGIADRLNLLGDLPSSLDGRAQLIFLKSKTVDDPNAEQYRPKLIEIAPGHFVAEYDEPII